MRTFGSHIHAALLRAIAAQAEISPVDRQKPIMVVEQIVSDDWASATFIGATHVVSLRLCGAQPAVDAAMARLVAGLAEREIPMTGHIVAEIAVTAGEQVNIGDNMVSNSLTVNALTVMD